jgi:hypothetical protein
LNTYFSGKLEEPKFMDEKTAVSIGLKTVPNSSLNIVFLNKRECLLKVMIFSVKSYLGLD